MLRLPLARHLTRYACISPPPFYDRRSPIATYWHRGTAQALFTNHSTLVSMYVEAGYEGYGPATTLVTDDYFQTSAALTPSESAAYHRDRPRKAPSPAPDKSMRPITFKEVQLWLQWNLKCPEIIDCATKSLMEKAQALTKGLQTVRDRGGKICQGEQRRANQE